MSDVFFTADTHFNHRRLCENVRGMFPDVAAMNEAMIERWNTIVKPGDRVYHLGDVALGRPQDCADILKRLSGQIYLVRGNHEKVAEHKLCAERFIWIKDYHYLEVYGQKVALSHYAFRVWRNSHHGSWHLYGHSHGSLPESDRSLSFDVGVDSWAFAPVSWGEVVEKMKTKEWAPVDGHGVTMDLGEND